LRITVKKQCKKTNSHLAPRSTAKNKKSLEKTLQLILKPASLTANKKIKKKKKKTQGRKQQNKNNSRYKNVTKKGFFVTLM
jgi:hypothetical protein